MTPIRSLVWVLAFAHGVVGCGGGPRASVMRAVEARDLREALAEYERYRDSEGGDAMLLAEVAGLLLEQEATGDDEARRDAAIGQIAEAGTAGRPVLDRLAQDSTSLVVRSKALGALARTGDRTALTALRALLDEDDGVVLSEAVVSLDAEDDADVERALELLAHTTAAVRRAAAQKLRGAAPRGAVRAALAEVARVDPEASVRSAAVRSLGYYGEPAFEPLRERLSDADAGVRMAAVGALVRADRARALSAISPLLEMSPSRAGIEAARVLADVEPGPESQAEGVVLARAFLRRALASGAVETRSQAAVALSSLRLDGELEQALVVAMESEEEPRVELSLAIGLRRSEASRAKAERALASLLEDDGIPGVQAAGLLAQNDDDEALRHLARAIRRGEPMIRRVAARAMAREALRPDSARRALRDDDALVRINAAGGILAASTHL